jgi:hypothetical protein
MVTQLRIYTINRGRMDDFLRAWRDGIYPLRLRHGFRISGAWVSEETNQFIWVISYAGPEQWDDMERAYSESPERSALEPDPSHYIAHAEHFFVTPTLPQT